MVSDTNHLSKSDMHILRRFPNHGIRPNRSLIRPWIAQKIKNPDRLFGIFRPNLYKN
jgi:hypothetical protein